MENYNWNLNLAVSQQPTCDESALTPLMRINGGYWWDKITPGYYTHTEQVVSIHIKPDSLQNPINPSYMLISVFELCTDIVTTTLFTRTTSEGITATPVSTPIPDSKNPESTSNVLTITILVFTVVVIIALVGTGIYYLNPMCCGYDRINEVV
jgi:hypothetical protein